MVVVKPLLEAVLLRLTRSWNKSFRGSRGRRFRGLAARGLVTSAERVLHFDEFYIPFCLEVFYVARNFPKY